MSHDTEAQVKTAAPSFEQRVARARAKDKAMRRAFKGILSRPAAATLDPQLNAWKTRSRHIDGQMGRAMRREVARTPGKKTRRLGAATPVTS